MNMENVVIVSYPSAASGEKQGWGLDVEKAEVVTWMPWDLALNVLFL